MSEIEPYPDPEDAAKRVGARTPGAREIRIRHAVSQLLQ